MTTELPTEGYKIIEVADGVHCLASHRSTFEPRGWLRTMRDDLSRSLKRLPRPSAHLYGRYSSAVAGFCDAENILFYNIGSSAFTGLGRNTVTFERSYESVGVPHALLYSTSESLSSCWEIGEVTAEWDVPLLEKASGRPDLKVEAVWFQMRRSFATCAVGESKLSYGLSLILEGPGTARIALMPSLKSLFDGAISGLHSYAGARLDAVATRLATKLPSSKGEITRMLVTEDGAALGPRELLWPFGDWVQWNPADDQCLQGRLERREGSNGWRLKGQLYTLARTEAS